MQRLDFTLIKVILQFLKFMLVYFTGQVYRLSDLPCEISSIDKYHFFKEKKNFTGETIKSLKLSILLIFLSLFKFSILRFYTALRYTLYAFYFMLFSLRSTLFTSCSSLYALRSTLYASSSHLTTHYSINLPSHN
jgi:hypothetical protein